MLRALLDVNVLIALLDAAHQHHRLAWDWLDANIEFGWASCPLTQNGYLRIVSSRAIRIREPFARPHCASLQPQGRRITNSGRMTSACWTIGTSMAIGCSARAT